MDDGHGFTLGWGDGPTAAQKVYALVRIHPSAGLDGQMQIQESGWRTRAGRRAVFGHGSGPRLIGTEACGAANGGVLARDLPIQQFLGGRVIRRFFVSQERDQSFLQGPKTAFNFSFGLRAGGDEMGHPQGGKGALKFRRRVPVVGGGSVAEEAQAIGIDRQRQLVLEKEPPKMLKMVPSCIGGHKAGVEQFAGMIVHRQQEGLLLWSLPPLVNGRVVLPQFIQARSLPAAARLGLAQRLGDEVGKAGADKGGDRFPMAFETIANIQFIGDELEIRRVLQRDKVLEELADLRWPIRPMISAGEFGAELGTILQPVGSEPVKVSAADLKLFGRFEGIHLALVEQAENLQQERSGQAFSQLFFSQSKMNPNSPWVEGLRRPPLRSGLLSPSTQGLFP